MELQHTRSDNEDLQRQPRTKYGSRPPECSKSDAEISQWLLEAEREDRRLAAIEQAEKRRVAAEKSRLGPSADKLPASAVRPRFHRGCKYRLPSADPIAIPTIPYDPLDNRWIHQDLKRRKASVSKIASKCSKALRELAADGFDIQCSNDVVDDLDDNEYGEEDGKQCPICSCSPKAVDQGIEIAVDQVTDVTIDQVTKVEVDQEIEIGVDAAAIITSTNTTQDTQASTTATATGVNLTNWINKIHFCSQRVLNIRRWSSVH